MRVLCLAALCLAALCDARFVSKKQDITWDVMELTPGRNLFYHLPPTARTTGIVWIFHPRGAAALGWLESLMMNEMSNIVPTLINLGYGIVAPDSDHRGFPLPPFYPVWSIPNWEFPAYAENGDTANIIRTIELITSLGVFDALTPVYAMGMSQGCDVMPLLGAVTPVSAVACQSGNGGFYAGMGFADLNMPTFFGLGTNATGGDGANEDRPGLQLAAIAELSARNTPVVQMRIPVTRPVTIFELLRIPFFTVADAEELLQVLRDQGCLDPQDYQYESPPWENGCKDFGRWNTVGREEVDSILRDSFGGNSMSFDSAQYIIGFFKDHQARVGTPCHPNCPDPVQV